MGPSGPVTGLFLHIVQVTVFQFHIRCSLSDVGPLRITTVSSYASIVL